MKLLSVQVWARDPPFVVALAIAACGGSSAPAPQAPVDRPAAATGVGDADRLSHRRRRRAPPARRSARTAAADRYASRRRARRDRYAAARRDGEAGGFCGPAAAEHGRSRSGRRGGSVAAWAATAGIASRRRRCRQCGAAWRSGGGRSADRGASRRRQGCARPRVRARSMPRSSRRRRRSSRIMMSIVEDGTAKPPAE